MLALLRKNSIFKAINRVDLLDDLTKWGNYWKQFTTTSIHEKRVQLSHFSVAS